MELYRSGVQAWWKHAADKRQQADLDISSFLFCSCCSVLRGGRWLLRSGDCFFSLASLSFCSEHGKLAIPAFFCKTNLMHAFYKSRRFLWLKKKYKLGVTVARSLFAPVDRSMSPGGRPLVLRSSEWQPLLVVSMLN